MTTLNPETSPEVKSPCKPLQGEEGDTLYEWVVREDGRGWQHWREKVPLWRYPANAEKPRFTQLLIPTMDSVRYEHLLSLVFSVNKVREPDPDEWPIITTPSARLEHLHLLMSLREQVARA
jgi:hypothetical protein